MTSAALNTEPPGFRVVDATLSETLPHPIRLNLIGILHTRSHVQTHTHTHNKHMALWFSQSPVNVSD